MSTQHSTNPCERGIILTRVSDPKQSGASSQLTGCRRLSSLYGVQVVGEVNDDGISGDDLEREGILETLALLQKAHKDGAPIGWLITDQSDRLSRADSLDTSEVLAKMRRLGVRKVATPARIFDLHNSLDRTLLSIEADHKNNPYLKDLGRRALNGMLDAARQGFWTGGKPPLGYRIVKRPDDHGGRKRKSGRLEIDPETEGLARELFRRYLDGDSVRALVKWLRARGVRRSRTGVEHLLRNEIYVGVLTFGRHACGRHAGLSDGAALIYAEGTPRRTLKGRKGDKGDVVRIAGFPAIIDVDTFTRVQGRLATGRRRGHKQGNVMQPLSGLCRCGACKAPLYYTKTHGVDYLICSAHKGDTSACPTSRHVRADGVLRRTLATLAEHLLKSDAVSRLVELAGKAEDDARSAWQAEIAAAERAVQAADAKLVTARRRLAEVPDDLMEDCQQLIRALKEEKAEAEAERTRLRALPPVTEEGDAELLTRWLATCKTACENALAGLDGPTANAILRELTARVTVCPSGRIEVELPEWLCRVLAGVAGRSGQHATRIVLVSEPAALQPGVEPS